MREAVASLAEAMTPFARAFLAQNAPQLKKQYPDPKVLENEFKSFSVGFKQLAIDVDEKNQELVRMQKARPKPKPKDAKK